MQISYDTPFTLTDKFIEVDKFCQLGGELDEKLARAELYQWAFYDLIQEYWASDATPDVKKRVTSDISNIFLTEFGSGWSYIDNHNLPKLFHFLLEEYGTHQRDIQFERQTAGEFHAVPSIVHPIMTAYMTMSLSEDRQKHNEDAFILRLLHDVPEDRRKVHKKFLGMGRPLELIVEDTLDVAEDIFGNDMDKIEDGEGMVVPGKREKKIADLRESFLDISRVEYEAYEHHATRLIFDKRSNFSKKFRVPKNKLGFLGENFFSGRLNWASRYSLNSESVIIQNLLGKLGDRLHNTVTMGELSTLSDYNPERSLHYEHRMKILLKNMYVINSTAQFLNHLSNEHDGRNIEGEYIDIYLSMRALVEITSREVQGMIGMLEGDSEIENLHSEFKHLRDARDQYQDDKGFTKVTPKMHDFEWYIKNHAVQYMDVPRSARTPINSEIYHGTLETINRKVDKLDDDPLYDLGPEFDTEIRNIDILKVYAHLLGVDAVLSNVFEELRTGQADAQLGTIENLTYFPQNPKKAIPLKYGIWRKSIRPHLKNLGFVVNNTQPEYFEYAN